MAKEKRSLFQRIFGTDKSVVFGENLQLLNNYQAVFTEWNSSIYDNITARSCIDAIARNSAKLSPIHVRQTADQFFNMSNNIKRIISEQPNFMMNAYDFYYKAVSQLYLNNNAFIYIEREKGTNVPTALYPIDAKMVTFVEYKDSIFLRFTFGMGKNYTAPLSDVIHLKRFFCENELAGGSKKPLQDSLSLLHTTKEGIANAIKTTAGIKGILKTTQAMLKDEDIKKRRDNFIRDFIASENSSGIAGLDATTDFKEVNINPQTATDQQMAELKNEVFEYFGISEAILKSDYTEDQWNSFYESTIEPIALMLSMEFTNKLFTAGQRSFGNKIVFEAHRIQYASNKTKIDIARYLNNYFTQNEVRQIFNMSPIEGGDRIMQDLNHIDSAIANDYQAGGDENA
jgi:HK97 family phage portal protein